MLDNLLQLSKLLLIGLLCIPVYRSMRKYDERKFMSKLRNRDKQPTETEEQ